MLMQLAAAARALMKDDLTYCAAAGQPQGLYWQGAAVPAL